MNDYFLIGGKNSPKVASAFAPEETPSSYKLIPILNGMNQLPFELNLVYLSIVKNGIVESNDLSALKEIWLDYMPNSLAWPLMSQRLKTIIVDCLTGEEKIDWISAIVKGNNEQRTYYIPRFTEMLDVLDNSKTMFIEGTDDIVRPWFSFEKVKMYSMFHLPSKFDLWKITPGIYVSEVLKKSIEEKRMTGLKFEKTRVS